MLGDNTLPRIPMAQVIANELEIIGSHGMQAFRYEAMWDMINSGKLRPDLLVGKTISLEDSIPALTKLNEFSNSGITVIDMTLE